MNKELEEAVNILKKIYKFWLGIDNKKAQAIETVLTALENSIPRQSVEDKIEEYRKRSEEYDEKRKDDFMGFWNTEFLKACHKMHGLQELLERK